MKENDIKTKAVLVGIVTDRNDAEEVEKSVYELINPKFCLWTAPLWLYDEPEIPEYLADRQWHKKVGRDRMWGTALTRKWMEELGVKKHYVSGEGTQILEI